MRIFLILSIAILFFASCSQTEPKVSTDELVHLTFNKKAESSLSGNQTTKLNYSEGIEGKGMNLKNSFDNLILSEADTSWFSNQNDFSVSIWVKSDSQTKDTTIILSNTDFRKKPMGIYGKRRISKGFTLFSSNGGWGWNIGNDRLHYNYEPVAVDQPIDDNKWHQLAFTYNCTLYEIRLYYDGINKGVLSIGDLKNQDFKSKLPMWIGENADVSPGFTSFNGTIDELKIWDKTISNDAIKGEFERFTKIKVKEPVLENNILTVVNWNIWHGGTHFNKEKDGFDGIERTIELIQKADADIVLMQETYGAGSQISSSLGFYYYEASSTIGAVWGANLSVMSRFPIEDVFMIEECSNYGKNYAFNNGGVKIRLTEKKNVIAFSNWYNGRKPEDLEGALTAWTNLVDDADNLPIVYAGDFNSVSHLDDGEGKSGHSKLMTEAGFTDTYRELFPDAKKYLGYTAGRFEDRIDYIYYIGNKLQLLEASPIDPNFKGKGDNTPGYPSDHLGLIARFRIR